MSDEEDLTYSSIKTVLGRSRRDQRWHLTDEVDILTFLGSSRFDLRSVETSDREVVEIGVTCVFGIVDLLVPAGTIVVLDGSSILAGAKSSVAIGDDPGLPRLEVTATTVMGRVRVRSPRADEADVDEGVIIEAHEEQTPAPAPAAAAEPVAVEPVAAEPTPADDESAAPEPVADESVAAETDLAEPADLAS